MHLNTHYQALHEQYLFSDIARKVNAYRSEHPDAQVISLGIGDVTLPLAPAIVESMRKAVEEMGNAATFHGYGPEQGYPFLREAIANEYAQRSVSLAVDEIFISDGAKSDLGNILDLFSADNAVLIPDPVYPVYVDTNLMAGRSIRYLKANKQNHFLPMPDPDVCCDLIYLCSPNNPTGAAYNREQLKAWVEYATGKGAVILFDAAYESFITGDDIPHSIYEIPGADSCAIEFCSFSKMAGFTGVRCGWTIVPHNLRSGGMSLNRMWLRRQTTKFNGVPYIVQRGAQAALSPEGKQQIRESIAYYQQNANAIHQMLTQAQIYHTGGQNSPYIWMECPGKMASWDFFQRLLAAVQVVGTPGAGFGKNGEGFFRLTAFGSHEQTEEAVRRMREFFQMREDGRGSCVRF